MAISCAIRKLFRAYHANPLALMREIGIQARLHSLIQQEVGHEPCRVQVRLGDGTSAPQPTQFWIERTQMEVRVTNSRGHGPKKSDLVVLRSTSGDGVSPITATRYANGPFDIVSKLHLRDVAAVVEVKAACSADFSARHSFRLDLEKLLELAEACAYGETYPELHFVLVDKSAAIQLEHEGYGARPVPHRSPIQDWHVETECQLNSQTARGRLQFWDGDESKGIKPSPRMTMSDTAPVGAPFVHVWQLRSGADGVATSGDPLLRYAVRFPTEQATDVA